MVLAKKKPHACHITNPEQLFPNHKNEFQIDKSIYSTKFQHSQILNFKSKFANWIHSPLPRRDPPLASTFAATN